MTVRIALLLALVLGVGSCQNPLAGRSEKKARTNAPDLVLSQTREDTLHCAKGRCTQFYRLVVDKKKRISVRADAPSDPRLPDFSLVLEDRDGHVVADDRKANQRPRRVIETLDPGLYYVRIVGHDKKDDQLSYKIVAKQVYKRRSAPRAPRKRAPPPPPTFFESEVLEVERAGGEPVAVLIEAGTAQGMVPGQTGELIEGDVVIGKLEIVDVYAEGSRARILGGLTAPITLDTRARLQK